MGLETILLQNEVGIKNGVELEMFLEIIDQLINDLYLYIGVDMIGSDRVFVPKNISICDLFRF